uniref:Uncharacterized protein n=1 Tax=Timema monikensis TaxID=170555 RepID=A0A7R9EET9_9NEOP|nr:unnamed protein product [Timema monikensis]
MRLMGEVTYKHTSRPEGRYNQNKSTKLSLKAHGDVHLSFRPMKGKGGGGSPPRPRRAPAQSVLVRVEGGVLCCEVDSIASQQGQHLRSMTVTNISSCVFSFASWEQVHSLGVRVTVIAVPMTKLLKFYKVRNSQTVSHCNGVLLTKPQTVSHCIGVLLTKPQTVSRCNGVLLTKPQTVSHCIGVLLTKPQTVSRCNGVLLTKPQTVSHCNGVLLTKPQTVSHCNGVLQTKPWVFGCIYWKNGKIVGALCSIRLRVLRKDGLQPYKDTLIDVGIATEERVGQSLQGGMAQTGKGGRNELENTYHAHWTGDDSRHGWYGQKKYRPYDVS